MRTGRFEEPADAAQLEERLDEPIPVLVLLPALALGGVETQIASLATGLERRRFRAIVACQHALGPVADDLRAAGISVHLLSGSQRFDTGFFGSLHRLIAKERIRIVISHGFSTGVAARVVGALAGAPVRILAEHSTGERDMTPFKHRVNRLLEPLAAAHVAIASGQIDYLVETKGIPRSKIVVIPNGVGPSGENRESMRAPTRAALGVDPAAPVAGILAALRPEKDHRTFLLASRFVADALPEARFLVVGGGPLEEELRREIHALDLEGRALLLGARRDVPQLLAAFDVSVLSSTDVETLPMAFLESMAAGLPLIGTAIGGVPELIDEGVNGRLIRPRDAQGLAEAMLELLRDEGLRRRMGDASRRIVAERFSREAMVRGYEALFERLLKPRTKPWRAS